MSDPKPTKPAPTSFQPPRGTRDFYPIEMARRLWLEDKWRRTAVRHGFDEIDGPTFEHLDLYTVKSGEGIISELFSFSRAGGETPFALRPEFTPTLARMVATKANALPKPIKWFSIGPYFRAERPQRGRLREFLQWNVDSLGDPSPEADAEVIACCVDGLRAMGLTPNDVRLNINDRHFMQSAMNVFGIEEQLHDQVFQWLDRRSKVSTTETDIRAKELGIPESFDDFVVLGRIQALTAPLSPMAFKKQLESTFSGLAFTIQGLASFQSLWDRLDDAGVVEWCGLSTGIVRGLAYYTGTVFEVHETTGAERAIAGGGRYDNLVELFGGAPTPAVGFAMGDVVISLVLQDKGLMPSDDDIARDLGLAPDAFILPASDDADALVLRPLLAALRRQGLHARRSYKSTRNVGKLLQDADKARARYAVILESDTRAQLKDLSSKEQHEVVANDLASLATALAERIAPPR
ncbi:MAG: histidine--tRNA ligase [Phycisphaerales bacterium]